MYTWVHHLVKFLQYYKKIPVLIVLLLQSIDIICSCLHSMACLCWLTLCLLYLHYV